MDSRPDDFLLKSREILTSLLGNHGIKLTTHVNIPQGSGLGTSSILILACIQTLKKLFGGNTDLADSQEADNQFNAVLAIEQMLTTGGGWQVS